jgi:hypothetical protein
MAVLTISREIGSQGAEIGRMVAEKLNYHFADFQNCLMAQSLCQARFSSPRNTFSIPAS